MPFDITPRQRRIAFMALAGAAAVVLLVAIIAIVAAVNAPGVWLGVCLVLLLLIIVAEIVLLMTDKRPMDAGAGAPDADVEFEL